MSGMPDIPKMKRRYIEHLNAQDTIRRGTQRLNDATWTDETPQHDPGSRSAYLGGEPEGGPSLYFEPGLEKIFLTEVRSHGGTVEAVEGTDIRVVSMQGSVHVVELRSHINSGLSAEQKDRHQEAETMGMTVTVLVGRAEMRKWIRATCRNPWPHSPHPAR